MLTAPVAKTTPNKLSESVRCPFRQLNAKIIADPTMSPTMAMREPPAMAVIVAAQ